MPNQPKTPIRIINTLLLTFAFVMIPTAAIPEEGGNFNPEVKLDTSQVERGIDIEIECPDC